MGNLIRSESNSAAQAFKGLPKFSPMLWFFAFYFLTSCVSSSPVKIDQQPIATGVQLGRFPVVIQKTILPQSYGESHGRAAGVEVLSVGFELVDSAVTVRPRTEVRVGPGVEFELTDAVLSEGERVLVYGLVGSWRRIVSTVGGVRGWAHRGSLRFDRHNAKTLRESGQKLSVKPTLLPLVFAHKTVVQILQYPGLEPLNTFIPQGKSFYLLKEESGRKLIWLTETNSVAWVKAEDML